LVLFLNGWLIIVLPRFTPNYKRWFLALFSSQKACGRSSKLSRLVPSGAKVRGQTRHTWDMNFKVRWTAALDGHFMAFHGISYDFLNHVKYSCFMLFLCFFSFFHHVSPMFHLPKLCLECGFADSTCRNSRTYQWMGSNFEEGPQRAEGQMAVCDFTDATTLRNEKNPPSPGTNFFRWFAGGFASIPGKLHVFKYI
jgi:hypothetical protein